MVIRLCLITLTLSLLASPGMAQPSNGPQQDETYLLRYSLQPGETLHYEVTHAAKTKTRIRGAEEVSQVHTVSKRHWEVIAADPSEMTFHHVVDAVEMTQQRGDSEELRWESESGQQPPAIFAAVADQLGRTLSTVTIDARGKETARENHAGTKASLGMGSLTLTFPEEPIAVGQSWTVPREVKTRMEDGSIKPIKIQERYTLQKVKTGVATLSLRSEPLTPLNNESIRAQVVQQLSNGVIRFDIDNGRMLSKQLDWDETVVGFQGANSLMEYRARLSESLIDGVQRTARR